jgi:hypothetical protein
MEAETLGTAAAVLKMNGLGGTLTQCRRGRFVANLYQGKFYSESLHDKAGTGLWYARCTGTGIKLEGEGATPDEAYADLRHRAREMRDEIDQKFLS